jgi:hypothetical protein
MRSLRTAGFYKSKTCPSAETLLLYTEADVAQAIRQRIAEHLSECDFCGTEILLLAKHAPRKDEFAIAIETVAMPAPLRRLAEELLSDAMRVAPIFADITFERERLTLTDA